MDEEKGKQPTKLGIYALHRLLGRGGMGAVYLAFDTTLHRHVALKVLAPELAADPAFVARFHREATSLARIRHPNLVHIYAVGQEANRHFIAMEYLKGHTVAEIVRQRGALPHPVAIRVLGQVLSALEKVHAAGIVHRDLKPANIIVDEDQRAILTDFGLAKLRHDHTVTTGNTLLGTPEYMAPELAEGGDADLRSDIYALGVILFELLTGRVPYHGNSAIATLRQHLESPAPSAATLPPGSPPELGAIVARAMAKKPAERYADVRALAIDLLAVSSTHELAELATAPRTGPAPATAQGHAAAPTTPTMPAGLATGAATAPLAPAGDSADDPTDDGPATRPTLPMVAPRGRGRGLLVAAAVLAALAAATGPCIYRKLAGPPEPKASKTVFIVTARGRSPVTGRLVKMEGEAGMVAIKTAQGVVEIPYREVVKMEPLAER